MRELFPRVVGAVGGLAIFSFGMVLTVQANLGVASWQAFHLGLSISSPPLLGFALTFGQAAALTTAVLILVSWLGGIRPHIATLVNFVVVPPMLDLGLALIPPAEALPFKVLLLALGVLVMGLGTAIYIRPRLGAGPRDAFMLAMVRKTGWRVATIRTSMEVTVLTLGFLMGAPIGVGTVVLAFAIGPTVAWFFRLFGVHAERIGLAASTATR
ncbi:MAG: hypothetical protein HY329_25005 [Chloroflexi bacterium]|nr:hypothetical protein [Chloroflexota bacterium]